MACNVGKTNTRLFQVNKVLLEEGTFQLQLKPPCLCEQKPLGVDSKGDILFVCFWLVERGRGICGVSVPETIEKLCLLPFLVKSGSPQRGKAPQEMRRGLCLLVASACKRLNQRPLLILLLASQFLGGGARGWEG